ncbi:GNAT family N-acetyltransferase [Amycolatopsis sp. NPDC052450]|uniref:GNAT family N-acetyltransferase n=1 Tax=Amycolatopsis sp. NPDC052450 TaxID=3363937 RepID=UPI0037CC45DD
MTNEVLLRAVERADLDVFFEQEQDPVAAGRAAFPPCDRERFMKHWETRVLGDPAVTVRTVLAGGRVAGNVVAWPQDGRHWVGYRYGREFWGGGVGSRGLALFLGEMPVRPLYADPVETNVGSVRVLEKCGFRLLSEKDGEHVLLVLEE